MNIYKLDEAVYKKYLVENITKIYTKARVKQRNKATNKFSEKLKIAGRMEFMAVSEACITIKGHKENFLEKPSFALFNPSNSDENFDVLIGCFDRVEVYKFVGTYILSRLKTVFYRDNGLGIFWKLSGPEIERTRKAIVRIFRKCGLSITAKVKLKAFNFLDIELDSINAIYRSYRKSNDNQTYININSNHPPSIKSKFRNPSAKKNFKLSSN